MNRRSAVAAALFTLAAPMRLAAQSARLPRIGYLTLAPLGDKVSGERAAFLEGLRELGYIDGKTVEIAYRSGEMDLDILEFSAQSLIDAKVDVIAASGTVPALVAKKLTRTIPIVMIFSSEPVLAGLIPDLARPMGNVTGVATIQTELDPKRLAMLKELSPTITNVAALWTRFHPSHSAELEAVDKAGKSLGLTLQSFDVTVDLLGALGRMEARRPDAIFVLWDVRTLNFSRLISDFALKHNLPTSMPLEPYVEAGGLMSYGPNVQSIFRRSAAYVHRVLRGAKPADLPVERPSKFDLVFNLKTAQKLGIKLPHALLLVADRVIQ